MKHVLIALLAISTATGAPAQEHHVFADVGHTPGISVTYNYKLAKWFGIGAGMQYYNLYLTMNNARRFTPALFADIRFNIRPEKNNQFFSFIDLGIDVYRQDKSYDYADSVTVHNIPHNNGFYSGLGLGYFWRITKRGGGPYVSLKMMLNWYTIRGYSIDSPREIGRLYGGGTPAISIGFKF